jgi:hypothetical protein
VTRPTQTPALPVWKRRMDAKCRVPTPNADVIYAMSYLDLKRDRPLVVQAPPGVLGMLSDFWQRPLTDVGLVGPDKGEGGQFLLVPPHYDGPPLPGGYTPQPRPPELVAGRDQIVHVV